MALPNVLYLGIKGTVIAFERTTGCRLWEAKLKGQGFVTVLVDGDRVIAATYGEVFCLDAADGRQLWHDPLRGFGYGLVSLATPDNSVSPTGAAELMMRQQHAAAASAAHAGH